MIPLGKAGMHGMHDARLCENVRKEETSQSCAISRCSETPLAGEKDYAFVPITSRYSASTTVKSPFARL